MISEDHRFRFTPNTSGYQVVDSGVGQLWALPELVQADVLGQAMERFDSTRGVSLGMLGLGLYQAGDLVRKTSEFHGSRLPDRDILVCMLMGNLDVFPLQAIHHLGRDCLDCGIWDGELGEPGYYYEQVARPVAPINPGDPEGSTEMWGKPKMIQRVSQMREQTKGKLNLTSMEDDDGCIILDPGRAYLFGFSPAVSIRDLNITLETRSNFGRWALAGAVNSITVHNPFNGVLTAEATTFAHGLQVLNTKWLPFQMGFEYVNHGLSRETGLTFSRDPGLTLEDAAREFQCNPSMMLPRAAKRQKGK